ncbi:MAG: hypothetical protein GYA61_06260 [Spirochaetales bacterium]|jgi:hypothetical protein|nr:hypothetical protein [Exilispira sp.]NMC67814.1 hypothetical protein [Spirochaetales bacterium]
MKKNITIFISVLLILIFVLQISAQDPKSLFIQAIKKQQAMFPKSFSCNIASTIFTDFLSQLPPDAFSKQLKDIVIILKVENGKVNINIDGIKPEYIDFALSYFNIYTELLSYIFISEEELNKQFENYTISQDKNVFILKDDAQLVSYNFVFVNNLIYQVSFFQDNSKKMDINIQYFTYKNYQLVKSINITNFDDKGNKKENIVINFSKYQF